MSSTPAPAPSGAPAPAPREDHWERLPQWLRPRSSEQPGRGQMRLIETTVLVLVAVLLSIATINDLSRQSGVNHRLIADLSTWRTYTGHAYHNLSIDQELLGSSTEHEVVCGNTSPGAPKAKTQLCLMVWGPIVGGRRTVHGGWYLPPRSEDPRTDRYGCFGAAGADGLCPR
jgi:hypothetical protein